MLLLQGVCQVFIDIQVLSCLSCTMPGEVGSHGWPQCFVALGTVLGAMKMEILTISKSYKLLPFCLFFKAHSINLTVLT